MKNLIIPIDHLVMLAELDDKESGQMAKAIAQYANKETAPSFSNGALKAIFTLFRSNIDAQRESSAKRREINTTNAMGKKSAAKKKAAKKAIATDSESQQIADDATEASEAVEESLPLDAIEAVYPKLVLIATNRSPFGNPSTKRRNVRPSVLFKPTSVKRLMPLTRCI